VRLDEDELLLLPIDEDPLALSGDDNEELLPDFDGMMIVDPEDDDDEEEEEEEEDEEDWGAEETEEAKEEEDVEPRSERVELA